MAAGEGAVVGIALDTALDIAPPRRLFFFRAGDFDFAAGSVSMPGTAVWELQAWRTRRQRTATDEARHSGTPRTARIAYKT